MDKSSRPTPALEYAPRGARPTRHPERPPFDGVLALLALTAGVAAGYCLCVAIVIGGQPLRGRPSSQAWGAPHAHDVPFFAVALGVVTALVYLAVRLPLWLSLKIGVVLGLLLGGALMAGTLLDALHFG